MNNIRNNNINFSAKLDIRPIQKDINRWQNIAKSFEKETQRYPKDVFEVSNGGEALNELRFYSYVSKNGDVYEHCCDLSEQQSADLLSRTNEQITRKLVKLFKMFKKEDESYDMAKDFVTKLRKTTRDKNMEQFEDKFWDAFVEKASNDFATLKNKDADFKDYIIY